MIVKHDRIFISATYKDLKLYRKKVIDSLQAIEKEYYTMEFFCAASNTTKQECLERVARSNIFILIVAMRYGSIDPETGKSYVQLEYEKAIETGCNILPYLIDESNQPLLLKDVDTDALLIDKLKEFKETIHSNHFPSLFTTEEDLATKVLQALYIQREVRKFEIEPTPVQGHTVEKTPIPSRTSWKDYSELFRVERYLAAYIPIINAPTPNSQVIELSYNDIEIGVDTVPYILPQEFQSTEQFDEHDGRSCRLSTYYKYDNKLKLFISETSYLDYLKSGEHLDKPYKNDPSKTNRDVFGSKLNSGSADFTLFNLTNLCGCGIVILTADNKVLITKHSESSSIYPGRKTYAASGTMCFGDHPDPFTEILFKTRQEIGHQIDISKLRMIGFGADARKLYFQFSFVEKVSANYADLQKQCEELIPISFAPDAIIEELVNGLWEPAAEATLLTLLIQEYGYEAVINGLKPHLKHLGRRDIRDEWDYRAACGGIASTLSIRYPKDKIPEISNRYISAILKFIGTDINGKDVLEIGSGDGRVTQHLMQEGAASVTCVDICERMINKSAESLKSFRDKIIFKNIFAQEYKRNKKHDVAVISLVLIHNVDELDFQTLVKNVCLHAHTVYIFEDVTETRPVSPYTKLRPAEVIIHEFEKNKFKLIKQENYSLVDDNIVFIQFAPFMD